MNIEIRDTTVLVEEEVIERSAITGMALGLEITKYGESKFLQVYVGGNVPPFFYYLSEDEYSELESTLSAIVKQIL